MAQPVARGDLHARHVFLAPAEPADRLGPGRGRVRPDGAYYVAELTGLPFAAGAANVYRVVPGQEPTVAHSGFTTVIDLAFGPDGSLYVLEHSTGPSSSPSPDGC